MSVQVHCDHCDKTTPEPAAGWYHLERELSATYADPPNGWWFCSVECLDRWAVARMLRLTVEPHA